MQSHPKLRKNQNSKHQGMSSQNIFTSNHIHFLNSLLVGLTNLISCMSDFKVLQDKNIPSTSYLFIYLHMTTCTVNKYRPNAEGKLQ
jgi:hypothetical protein